jgi:hypothetical protein
MVHDFVVEVLEEDLLTQNKEPDTIIIGLNICDIQVLLHEKRNNFD